MRVLAATLALLLGLAMGATVHAALSPTAIAGVAAPTPSAFLATGKAPALPYVPLALPGWAPATSPWGALPVDIASYQVRYADGSVVWLDDLGVAWWDFCLVPGAEHSDCAYSTI